MVLALAAAAAVPLRVRAWEGAGQIVHGSARLLEKGETIVGIISPLGYGLHERVTLFTHPALLLLLTPNAWVRIKLLDGDGALAFEGGYEQTLLVLSGEEEGAKPGYFQAGAVYSHLLTNELQLNAALGFLAHFGQSGGEGSGFRSGLYWRLGANFVLSQLNLLLAEVRASHLSGSGLDYPTGTLLFARQFGRMRLGVGAGFGSFPLAADFFGAGASDEQVHFYAYPWADLWWRF